MEQLDEKMPLHFAVQKNKNQIVQILLEKGEPNVDLADKVILLLESSFSFLFFFFLFLIFLFFFYFKNGITPLHVAVREGFEQIVQILLEKGGANVNPQKKVLFLLKKIKNTKNI